MIGARCWKNVVIFIQTILSFELSRKVIGSNESEDQKNVIKAVKTLYEPRQNVIKLFDNYSRMVSEAKYKAKRGKELKILGHKQMLQRLSIALAQEKAGDTSANLLNETRQIIYPLYREQKFTKKVYNNKMNSVKL